MNQHLPTISLPPHAFKNLQNWISQHIFRLLVLGFLVLLLVKKDITLQLHLANKTSNPIIENPKSQNTSFGIFEANILDSKLDQQQQYIQRFAKVAQTEMKKYGIPASITLAQGLLETNAGNSVLATKSNNHFGIKCFEKKCKKGHCLNYSDDSHKDFFRKFPTAWDSYRAHSILLQKKRYADLKKLDPTDYRAWATGLQAKGYATDPTYGQKLVRLIERLGLERFDG